MYSKDETVWLTQKTLAELFGVKVPAVNTHLKDIFASGELVENSVVSILELTEGDGKSDQTRYHNPGDIISGATEIRNPNALKIPCNVVKRGFPRFDRAL